MKKAITILIYIGLVLTSSFGYTDLDLDGVDDSKDKCPNTPFDVLVDSTGCPIEKKKNYTLFFKTGAGLTKDGNYSNYLWNLTAGISYKRTYFSLSTNYYINDSILDKGGIGDTYLYGNYMFNINKLFIYPGITIKIPTASEGFGNGKFDYTPSMYIDFVNSKIDIFMYYGFIFRGDQNFEDMYTTSVGAGYRIKNLYLSLSYDFNGDNSKYLSIFSTYDISRQYYVLFNYSYGINQQAIKHFTSLKVGVRM